jgi:hypothetical protein
MLADRASAALFAPVPLAAMLTDRGSTALFALAPHAAMLADPASPALFALVPLAVVRAVDPVTVPPHCTALGVTAAAAIVVTAGTSASAAPAVEVLSFHTAVNADWLRQPVDQYLPGPFLWQPRLQAELLQLSKDLLTGARVPREVE